VFDLTRPDLDTADRKLVDAFAACLRETPAGLLDAPPETWPDLFPSRLAFEDWRRRWLPYWAGLADGPTDREQYATLRPKLFSMKRTRDVDRFHA
jgi:hypothetical protein